MKKRKLLLYMLIFIVIMLLWLIAFYPGVVSPDTWGQLMLSEGFGTFIHLRVLHVRYSKE